MGFYSCFGACYFCKKMITFNPLRVPSIKNQPICKNCAEIINKNRIEKGLDPIIIYKDAYKEVLEEGEI